MKYNEKTYSRFDVADILGIKRQTLKDWQERGFISPSVKSANGQGTKNIFNKNDILKIKIFIKLLEIGFVREKAADLIKEKMQRPIIINDELLIQFQFGGSINNTLAFMLNNFRTEE